MTTYYDKTGAVVELVHDDCGRGDQITECNGCNGIWCDRCDPAHGPLCPWCHGMGYSTAAIAAPAHLQANHVLHNGGYPIQEDES